MRGQVGRQFRQALVLIPRPAIFDRHALALDITGFGQGASEYREIRSEGFRGAGAEISDHRWLLRARSERQRSRATEKRDELAPLMHLLALSRAAG